MGVSMPKITVSGHPGSGTSSLVKKLMEYYNWDSVNGGQIFRNEAKARNMSLAAFGKLCNEDESVDRELDEKLKQFISVVDATHIGLDEVFSLTLEILEG